MTSGRNCICGWELNNPDAELFDTQVVDVLGACKDCEYLHQCRSPAESIRCLAPRNGNLLELHREHSKEGDVTTYFALLQSEGIRFIQLKEPGDYWANARCIPKEDVPPSGLTRLEKMLSESG